MVATWAAITIAGVGAVLLGTGVLNERASLMVSDTTFPAASLLAAALILGATTRYAGRERTGWLLVGSGVASWAIAESLWAVIELRTGSVPFPGITDVFYLLAYPLVIGGLAVLPWTGPMRRVRLRIMLDAVVVGVTLFALVWTLYLRELFEAYAGTPALERAVGLAYPVCDVLLLIVVVLVATRSRSTTPLDPRLALLGVAMLAFAGADSAYLIAEEVSTYISGAWFDSLWLAAYGAFALLGWHLSKGPQSLTRPDATERRSLTLGPAMFVLVVGVYAFQLVTHGPSALVDLSVIVVAAGVLARQAVAIRHTRELVERERDELVGSISHELRTPLTAISGFTSLLRTEFETVDETTRREMLETVDRETQYVTRIVTDLVELARSRLEATPLQFEWLPVRAIVRSAEALVPDLGSLDVRVPLGLEVRGDRGRITQVLINLMTNAVRYGNGAVMAVARPDDDGVVFEVHDDGAGVPPQHIDLVWKRFERGTHRYNSTVPGSGLGLSIALSLVNAHGGTMDYRPSEMLGGACFSMRLPTARTVSSVGA